MAKKPLKGKFKKLIKKYLTYLESLKWKTKKSDKKGKLKGKWYSMLLFLPLLGCSTHSSTKQEALIPGEPLKPTLKARQQNNLACFNQKDFKNLYLYLKEQEAYTEQLLNLLRPVVSSPGSTEIK